MKRLKSKLLSAPKNTTTYKEMYEGTMNVVYHGSQNIPPEVDYNSTYYSGNIGFEITTTHKLAQDKPTITIIIPIDKIFCDIEGLIQIKRLKYHLNKIENHIGTYKNLQIPVEKLVAEASTTAAADFCLREFKKYIEPLNAELYNRSRPENENGKYYLQTTGGEVLKRNTAFFDICPQKDYINGSGSTVYLLNYDEMSPPKICLCIRMLVQLPKGKIRKAIQMLCRDLPDAVDRFLAEFDIVRFNQALALAEKQTTIRKWLKKSEYCAFVANGSILPREKGTDLPMLDAIPFKSTPHDEIEIFGVRGMGIKKGVTVITGGGYSGKSTLLDAISTGIYDHALGDGRELCITDPTAITISAEDGRSVKHVNISPFIKWLPGGDTSDFSTDHASGSTSQAANIMEAVDCGAKLLLIDEDKSATNFMIRDRMMKELIEKEPITPFTDRANELFRTQGVSTILVIGGSGEYLSVADKIYMMEDYLIHDVTDKSKSICNLHNVTTEFPPTANWKQQRVLYSDRFSSYPTGSGTEKLKVSDMGFVIIGDEKIDVRGLHNIATQQQLDALGFMLRYLEISNTDRKIDINKKIDEMYARIEKEGIDFLYSSFFTTCERFLDLPRKQELKALINRMRKINMVKETGIV